MLVRNKFLRNIYGQGKTNKNKKTTLKNCKLLENVAKRHLSSLISTCDEKNILTFSENLVIRKRKFIGN